MSEDLLPRKPPPPPEWPVPLLDKVSVAFPANALDWMPTLEQIPSEFKSPHNEWVGFVSSWFRVGLPETVLFYPRPGIKAEAAYDALYATLKSFAAQHQHKIAAAAYMASCWFTKVAKWQWAEGAPR